MWDNQYYPYYSQFCHNDCADFLSQALAHGGIPKTDDWNGWGTRYTQTKWVRANEVPQMSLVMVISINLIGLILTQEGLLQ